MLNCYFVIAKKLHNFFALKQTNSCFKTSIYIYLIFLYSLNTKQFNFNSKMLILTEDFTCPLLLDNLRTGLPD